MTIAWIILGVVLVLLAVIWLYGRSRSREGGAKEAIKHANNLIEEVRNAKRAAADAMLDSDERKRLRAKNVRK